MCDDHRLYFAQAYVIPWRAGSVLSIFRIHGRGRGFDILRQNRDVQSGVNALLTRHRWSGRVGNYRFVATGSSVVVSWRRARFLLWSVTAAYTPPLPCTLEGRSCSLVAPSGPFAGWSTSSCSGVLA